MSFSIGDLEVLRKRLDRDRRELEERERALAKVEEMLREELSQMQADLPISGPDGIADDSFIGAVRTASASFDDREFSVSDVEAFLRAHDVGLPKNDARIRISMALQSLREEGLIERTFEGRGRTPHRYKAKR